MPEIGADRNTNQGSLPFAALNSACFADAAVVIIPDDFKLEQPIQILFVSSGASESEGQQSLLHALNARLSLFMSASLLLRDQIVVAMLLSLCSL